MFSKAKDPKTQTSSVVRAAPSLISVNLQVAGDLSTDGEVQIDGTIDGDVSCGRLTVGEKARIKGEITADSVTVKGTVTGRIRARSVQLAKTAKVTGDIWHEKLSIESGAILEGLCKHTIKPQEGADGPQVERLERIKDAATAINAERPIGGDPKPALAGPVAKKIAAK